MTDLLEQVDWSGVECLNSSPGHEVQNALKQGYREDPRLTLQSNEDTDEQLLIHVPFNTAVKISKIQITGTREPSKAPRGIKLFINRPTIGFGEATDLPGDAAFELNPAQAAGEEVTLRVVKFQRINCLTIFVETNQSGEEVTVVEKIRILGQAGDTFDVASIKDVSKEDE